MSPDWEIEANSMMRAYLTPFLSTFEGILAYTLQRGHVNPDNQSKPTYVRLFVIWKSEGYKNFVRIQIW
jgi:hypothetical protein